MMMKKNIGALVCAALLLLVFVKGSCKKSETIPDAKSSFTGNWAGSQQFTGVPIPYKFSLAINLDNTVVNIDSAFGNQVFPGTYTYSSDSLKITYANGTKWSLKFLNNYTGASGTVAGYAGGVATVSMLKK